MRPFVILALPRTGTKMLASALARHPEISHVTHEFRGGLWQFLKRRAVLSNYRKWWMRWPIRVIHVYREDVVAGACSMLLLPYVMPDGMFELPEDEVARVIKYRNELDADLGKYAEYSVSYEQICGGREATRLDTEFSYRVCDLLGIERRRLKTGMRKEPRKVPSNIEKLRCLPV